MKLFAETVRMDIRSNICRMCCIAFDALFNNIHKHNQWLICMEPVASTRVRTLEACYSGHFIRLIRMDFLFIQHLIRFTIPSDMQFWHLLVKCSHLFKWFTASYPKRIYVRPGVMPELPICICKYWNSSEHACDDVLRPFLWNTCIAFWFSNLLSNGFSSSNWAILSINLLMFYLILVFFEHKFNFKNYSVFISHEIFAEWNAEK